MSAYSDRIVADGASNYWRLNETGGITAVDSVGGADATGSGGVTVGVPSPLNDGTTALTFDGVSGKLQTAAAVTVPLVCTIEAWMKPTNVASGANTVWSSRFTAGGIQLFLSGGALACYSDGATPPQMTGPAALLNVWQHVVLVHTGAVATFYVNGVSVFSGAQTRGAQTPIPVGIGSNPGGSNFFAGSLDEVAVYPRALPPTDIAMHFSLRNASAVPVLGPRDYNTTLMGYLIGVTP